jgi:PAS domain S-box-containing protein
MVVEDELIVAEDLAHWLTSLGYTVSARTATGREAIQLCETVPPELVLMDILLPGDMDGIQAAEIIRRRFDIPVVYLTASSDEATLARAKVTEPFGYILKPFDERGLYSTIEMAFYKHASERRIRNSEERFRLLYENAPVPFHSLDADGHILGVNKAWLELMGHTQDEVVGHWFGEFLAHNSTEPFIAYFTKFRLSPVTESIVLDLSKRDGSIVSAVLKGSIAVDNRGLFEMTQCVLEGGLHTAGSSVSEGPHWAAGSKTGVTGVPIHGSWLQVAPDGRIQGGTPAIETLLGYPVARLCQMKMTDLCVDVADANELLRHLASHGSIEERSVRLRGAGGEAFVATTTGFLLHGPGGMAGSSCICIRKG